MRYDMTEGPMAKKLIFFALPMILGDILQQLYNVADTAIVGRFVGKTALAAVGSSFSIMAFAISVVTGMCMGAGVVFGQCFGARDPGRLARSAKFSFFLILGVTVGLSVLAVVFCPQILHLVQMPQDTRPIAQSYLQITFGGLLFTFLYNYCACLLRSVGNSRAPLYFLAAAGAINVLLDLLFVAHFGMGAAGAAWATVIAQFCSAVGCCLYCYRQQVIPKGEVYDSGAPVGGTVLSNSLLTALQQSVLNFGMVLVQGLVNSYGVTVMASFAAASKIHSFASLPATDFGNAFSTFVAQNSGAKKPQRIKQGLRTCLFILLGFSLVVAAVILLFSRQMIGIFIDAGDVQAISIGADYLHVEAYFYFFMCVQCLFYGFYRGLSMQRTTVVLSVASLGTRTLLSYLLAATAMSFTGIYWAVPIGWMVANCVGVIIYRRSRWGDRLLAGT